MARSRVTILRDVTDAGGRVRHARHVTPIAAVVPEFFELVADLCDLGVRDARLLATGRTRDAPLFDARQSAVRASVTALARVAEGVSTTRRVWQVEVVALLG